jgi:hypothetical protein
MGAREDLPVPFSFFDDCIDVLCLNVPSVSLEAVSFEPASQLHVAKTKVSATPICWAAVDFHHANTHTKASPRPSKDGLSLPLPTGCDI